MIVMLMLACYLTLVPVVLVEHPTVHADRNVGFGFRYGSIEPASAPVRPNDPGSGGGGGGVHS
jgi:hypothetical protein